MNNSYIKFFFIVGSFLCSSQTFNLPRVNLGLSSFLDGGPLRPKPGFYWQQFVRYYTANKLLDECGKEFFGLPSPHFNALATSTQLIYQRKECLIPNAQSGIVFGLPFVLHSKIEKNRLGILNSGAGIGNPVLGVFVQFDPIFRDNEIPLFVHRLEFDVAFPLGKNEEPDKTINPASKFFYIDPYWAFTLYFNPRFATSWRFHYLWCAKNHKTNIKEGDAVHFNYSVEYALLKNLWVGINGYFLQQLKNDTFQGIQIPHSKERVRAFGAGILYISLPKTDWVVSFNFYVEQAVRNRFQGVSYVFRVLKYF